MGQAGYDPEGRFPDTGQDGAESAEDDDPDLAPSRSPINAAAWKGEREGQDCSVSKANIGL